MLLPPKPTVTAFVPSLQKPHTSACLGAAARTMSLVTAFAKEKVGGVGAGVGSGGVGGWGGVGGVGGVGARPGQLSRQPQSKAAFFAGLVLVE